MNTNNLKKFLGSLLFLFSISVAQNAFSFEWVERTRDQFGKDSSYFIYPIVIDIPGLGTSSGVGSTVLNIKETDLDFSGFLLRGDFDVTGGTFLNYHILENRLLFDIGYYDFEAAVVQYDRGIGSNKDNFYSLKLNGKFLQSQLTWTFNERHIETFAQFGVGKQQVTDVLDKNDIPYSNLGDGETKDQQLITLGFRFDNTSDRIHPREGYRLEMALKIPRIDDPFVSEFVVADYNATFYFPFRERDTLAINFFKSDALVTKSSTKSKSDIEGRIDFDCQGDFDCESLEQRVLDQSVAANKHGTATSIGGTQRLRSFANDRYFAGHSMFYGIEYRMNLNDERKPFDFYIAKGIRTGLQLAFFAEQGSVAESAGDLFDTVKTSFGVGFRIVLTGVIIRADLSSGSEGEEFLLFIDYPWSLLSIDS